MAFTFFIAIQALATLRSKLITRIFYTFTTMKLIEIQPKAAVKELLNLRPLRSDIDNFKNNLLRLLSKVDEIEREENQKNHVRDFLLDTYYKETNEINTKDNKDLVIHVGKSNKDKVGVIIEAKRPGNKSEMLSIEKPNTKAFHELVLYYMRERIDENNIDIKHCIATNIYEWFIIDSQYFEKFFARNKSFVKEYEEWRDGKKVTRDTNLFYNDIVKPYVDKIQEEIPCTRFDIRTYEKALKNTDKVNDRSLIALYKAQSPYHLLRKTSEDSNQLNDKFYKELLYIIGLEEIKEGGKNIIRRKAQSRNAGSLLENTIQILETEDLYKIKNVTQYGSNSEERLFNIALELTLTWINRVLFLKLLEGQLVKYHRGDQQYKFLDSHTIHDYDELYKLFHNVLARPLAERADNIKDKYKNIPYLNSSLFEISDLEDQAVRINSLDNTASMELMTNTVLKEEAKKKAKLTTIDYIFKFLDAYDFASEGGDEIQENSKSLINASVLGKVFEKINGYRDGSIYTPAFITMYMCRESIRMAVVQKFNDHYGWACKDLTEVYNSITDIKEANTIVNSLKICDPAVGSGHFLVSALNEIIAIKAELKILQDEKGKRIKEYTIEIINDELVITDEYNDPFIYNPKSAESQRIQKTLFQEKQTIIENCLFGVDINSNSVKICRLRLWIELLKNAYYKEESNYTELETLPNIDINIKCGNSLISRYATNADLTTILKDMQYTIADYRAAVYKFKNATERAEKRQLIDFIEGIKKDFQTHFSIHDERRQKLSKARGELVKLQSETLFETKKKDTATKKKIDDLNKKIGALTSEIDEIKNNVLYQNAFEWRFEFPEVLNDQGEFEGFDVLIGNPPYIQLQKLGAVADTLQKQGYKTFVRTGDIYCLFYEKGIELLKLKGVLSYITSNKWMRASYGDSMRDFLLTETNPMQLIDFSNLQLFDAVTVNTNILISTKAKNQNVIQTCMVTGKIDSLKEMSDYFNQNFVASPSFELGKSWAIMSPIEGQIKRKIELLGMKLKDWDIQINRGILTGFNEAFIIDGATRDILIAKSPKNAEIIRPILKGRNIRKFVVEKSDLWLINTHNGLKTEHLSRINVQKDYPAIYDYLYLYKTNLETRQDKGDDWTNLRNCAYLNEFDKEKIVWLELSDTAKFAYDDTGIMIEATAFMMTGEKLKFLAAFFNSKLCEWYFDKITTSSGVGTNRWKKIYLESLHVPRIQPEVEEKFIYYVDCILQAKKLKQPTDDTENKINQLFYSFFGLTNDEIQIVSAFNS